MENEKETYYLISTKIELEVVTNEIKELVIEFEKSDKKIENYFDDNFVLAVRSDNFNTDPDCLDILKKYKTKLINLILINKIEKTNVYLDKILIERMKLTLKDLEEVIEAITMILNRINSTNESEKYFEHEEYINFFNKVYYLIKLSIKKRVNLANIYNEINTNKNILKIINDLIIKEIRITESSSVVEKESFNSFLAYCLNNALNENELINEEFLKRMLNCYSKESRDNLNEKLESNIVRLTETNKKLDKLLTEELRKHSEVTSFYNNTKPNYIKNARKRLLSLFLSGLLSLGIAFGIEEISYKSIHHEFEEKTNTEIDCIRSARVMSMLFGMTCALIAAFDKDLGLFGLIKKLQKLENEYSDSKEYNECLIKKIKEIREELEIVLKSEEDLLNVINCLLDEILITANRNYVITPEIKKLTRDASYKIERTKHVLNI